MTAATQQPRALKDALDAPRPKPADYSALANAELDAFLALLAQLEPGDWRQPTACSLWDVRDVVAHQAGHIQSGMGFAGIVAQANPFAIAPYRKRGMAALDGMNQKQIEMRRDWPTGSLIAELREGTPRSIAARERLNFASARVPLPVAPVGLMSLKTLLLRIFPRDMWIHRLDIADATGKPFETANAHTETMLALAVEDAARFARKKDPALNLGLHLQGPAASRWDVARGAGPRVELELTLEDFLRRTSGRITAESAAARAASNATAEQTVRALELLQAPY
jgi:uncharacterized protein (TIGR03083 family)